MNDPARLRYINLASLSLVGILTVSLSTIWFIFDPWLMRGFGFDWLTIHTVYSVIAVAMFLDLSFRVLAPSRWPWKWLLAWFPIAVWSAVSSSWSFSPRISSYVWSNEILLGAVMLIWGYSLGYRQILPNASIKLIGLAVLAYASIRLVDRSVDPVFGTTWFCIIFPPLLWWLSEECKRGSRVFYLLLVIVLITQALVFRGIPQRMFFLTLFLTTAACAFFFRFLRIEPNNTLAWRAALGAIAMLFAVLFVVDASRRGVSSLQLVQTGADTSNDRWYRVFIDSERWVIFGFWLQQGMANVWKGVGLGASVPGIAYAEAIASTHPDLRWQLGNALNYFIDVWLQVGIVGLLLQLYMLRTSIGLALMNFARMGADYKKAAVVLVLMFFAVFFRNLANDGFHAENVIVFWLIVGFILGIQGAMRDRSPTPLVQERVVPAASNQLDTVPAESTRND